MFDRLRAAIEAALDAAARPPDRRRVASGMREAILEARTALEGMRDAAATTERRMRLEHKYLEDAERRGRQAEAIDDQETVAVAQRFVSKHRERARILEQKLDAQRRELDLAERELAEMKEQFKQVDTSAEFESAWRELDASGGPSYAGDSGDDVLGAQLDRAAREARAEAQLAELKRRMGR